MAGCDRWDSPFAGDARHRVQRHARNRPDRAFGKTVVELSTGDAGEAKSLMEWIRANGADCLIGMIYGALLCVKAGVSMDDYVDLLPLTVKIVHDYYDVFAASVPSGNFADPPASMDTYFAAFQNVLKTCGDLGTPDELPRLLHDLAKRGIDAGFGDQRITALRKVLRR